jgi:F0F1-type ATP synthase epsilon subunit
MHRVLSDRVNSVTLPGVLGELTILPHHTHIVTSLKPGRVKYTKMDEDGEIEIHTVEIARGVAEMSREGRLIVFTAEATA